jgi:hypothetical protein
MFFRLQHTIPLPAPAYNVADQLIAHPHRPIETTKA